MLRLGGEVRLGGALLRLGRPECSVNLDSGMPRLRDLRPCLGILLHLGVGVSG